jgi:hypothetical protein
MVLRLPVAATTLASSRPALSTKLTRDAVKELVMLAEDCEALNVLPTQRDLAEALPRTATPNQRRTLDDPTGGTL